MIKELEKTYDPQGFESRIYQFWMDGGYFTPKIDENKTPYTIVIPPPNITAQLHMGHALNNTLQDVLIRYKRLQGFSALWIPGSDHASIATEAKIVESMKAEGLTKEALGREKFLERAWIWKDKYSGRIMRQLRRLGSSCDWTRERFTLDEGCNHAVNHVFVRLYEKGLIYRGERIINWCPFCKTSISDAEVDHEEQQGSFWHIRYPLTDGSGYLELATTRPETLLGDTAVAVNPKDTRYSHLVGKSVMLPLCNRSVPIVADDYVEMDFGTGVVKITPAHDPNDFEVGKRHDLPIINVMTEEAYINENGLHYVGMERYEARKQIVKDLEQGGFLVKVEPHVHNVGQCYRCHTTVEPRVSLQWFVKMESLAGPAIAAVKTGKTKFIPEHFNKTYFNWLENIRDWCISRQLWWGHRIPAYYCECGEVVISEHAPDVCPKCGGTNFKQDEDSLDTWFSSALWPFSTLGWPEETADLKYFYPTNTLVTGYDIITNWVMRMVFSALEYTGQVPFDTVLINGLVRDDQGRKMSKSLGNGIDPLEIIDEYGADALRMMLVTGNSPGNDMRFSEEKVKSSRNFANKLWNATRFIMMNCSEEKAPFGILPADLAIEDKWVLSLYNALVKEVTDNLDKFELGVAMQKLYDFIWDILCDWYIELTKARLQSGGKTALNAQNILVYIMSNVIKLLHPFLPFITEEIYQALRGLTKDACESIMISTFPVFDEKLCFAKEEEEFGRIMEAIKGIRNIRNEMNVPPSKKAEMFIATDFVETFKSATSFFERLASASEVHIATKRGEQVNKTAVQVVTGAATIFIPLDDLVDRAKEMERLQREKIACEKDIAVLSGKLNNEGFLAKAPANIVELEQSKLAKAKDLLAKIEASM